MRLVRDALGGFRPRDIGSVRPEDPQKWLRWVPSAPIQGVRMDFDSAMMVAVVWACMDAITKAIACCDWNIYRKEKNQNIHLPDDPVAWMFNTRANSDQTAVAWRECMMYSALGPGNSYSEIVRNGAGQVAELWPLPTDSVSPFREPEYPYKLMYEYKEPDGTVKVLEPSRVFHLRGPGVGTVTGDNMIARMVNVIALAVAAERFATTYFGNNTIIGGTLEYPKVLDDKAYKRLKEDWDEKRKGVKNMNRPLILEGGMKWNIVGNKPTEAQLIEARKFAIEEICRFFGVPPHKIQHLDRATFNNIEHLGLEFVRDALTPWAKRLCQEADYKLFPMRAPWRSTQLDMAWLSKGDFKTRWEGYQVARRVGAYSVNDILRKEGENTIGPAGDIRIVESNMTRLELVGQQPQAPAAPKQPEREEEEDLEEEEEVVEQRKVSKPARQLARECVNAMLAGALDRYYRRLQNRAADLERRGLKNGKASANLYEERERMRNGWLQTECAGAVDLVSKLTGVPVDADVLIVRAADEVDNGVEPHVAAERLADLIFKAARRTK